MTPCSAAVPPLQGVFPAVGRSPDRWRDTRAALLEDPAITAAAVERKRRAAGTLKLAILLVPLALTVLVLELAAGDLTLLVGVGLALLVYGGIAAFRLGSQWQARWDEVLEDLARSGS